MWFTFFHSWVSGVILGLVTFLFNMKIKGSGTFLASFLLVLSAVASKQISLVKISPISWSTLNYIQLKPNDGLPSYEYISIFYVVMLVLLFLVILFSSKNYNFDKELKK